MKITKYKKQGQTYYKFQIRLGDKVTRRSGFKSKNEAIFAYTKLLEEHESKLEGDITYEQTYEQWLNIYQSKVKETTYQSTTSIFRLHILPEFGKLKVKDISAQMCQDFAMKHMNYVKGKEYFAYAKRVLDYALKMNYIKENPFDRVILPNFKASAEKLSYLTAKQVNTLLDYFKDNQYWHTLFRLMIYTGIRRGETLALLWDDIDFKNKTLTVNKSLGIGENKKVIVTTPKTKNSNRTIDLDDQTLLELKKLKVQSTSPIIFPNKKGTYNRLSNIADKLTLALKDLDLPQIRVHDLRHTHATLLFASGADIKFVQKRLGHSRIETTLNIYIHVTKDLAKEDLNDFVQYMEAK